MKKFLLIIFLSLLFSGCTSPKNFERSEILMGTVVTLKAEGKNSQVAVEESFNRIAELEKNIFVDVKKIEDAAGVEFVKISPDVYKILETAQKFSKLTDGAFDVTIGAAVELWAIGTKNPRVPTNDELAAVKNFVGFKHLHLRNGAAYLDKRGVKINLGGVAKGYGVDLARKIFDEHSITSGLIDFGTSTIFAVGKKKIGIKNPRADEISEIIELENSALSTSGDYEKFFIVEGRRYHHIIDPKTCTPAENENFSVSVLVDGKEKNCAMVADILSTAAFVLGKERLEKILTENNLTSDENFQSHFRIYSLKS
ncbi:MAG: FAD:protein FMN transferase [Selenomonadaceae bacterium]|nr:FAD:protein FMN transferase [Selenomonadaceae bacterium]